jgi:heme A synthase
MPDTAPAPAADHPKMNTQWEFLYRVAERFGMPTIILLLILWWVRNDFLKPLLEAHYEVIGKIVDGQKTHTDRLDSIGRKLDELISVSSRP